MAELKSKCCHDLDSVLPGETNKKSGEEGEEDPLIHLTANRAKAPKRRPPSSHFISGINTREVILFVVKLYL